MPILLLLLGLVVGAVAAEAAGSAGDFRAILAGEARRHPRLQPQDCYKLVYQGCLGGEHAVGDSAGAARWLERELAALGPGPDEPLVEPVSPDGRLVRLHLRPFVAGRGDPARLLQAFVQTAQDFKGTRGDLPAAWAQVVQLAEAGRLPFTAKAAREFGEKMAAAGYPAVHHSTVYADTYHPAYRVLARELLPGIMPR